MSGFFPLNEWDFEGFWEPEVSQHLASLLGAPPPVGVPKARRLGGRRSYFWARGSR